MKLGVMKTSLRNSASGHGKLCPPHAGGTVPSRQLSQHQRASKVSQVNVLGSQIPGQIPPGSAEACVYLTHASAIVMADG